MTRHAPIASLRLCAFALTVPMLLAAQTSNVETVRAWRRTHVMGVPGGTLLDPTGSIAEGFYSVPDALKEECRARLSPELLSILLQFERQVM